MKKKTILELAAPAVVASSALAASLRLFDYAFKRVDYIPETSADKQKYATAYYHYVDWYKQIPKEKWVLHPDDLENRLVANFIPAPKPSKQTVIISHGYKGDGEIMANYAQLFYNLGYNVLLPDDRSHGESAGDYINFGWLDRLDYLEWLNKIIVKLGTDSVIVLYGASMGGATVEMMSGEKLPPQVKALIADSGYSSIEAELSYLLRKQFHLPKYPFVPLVSMINKRRLGYYLSDVESTSQLSKNHLPILFIHGDKDVYVPHSMAFRNYDATQGPRELWIVKGASHVESFWLDPVRYQNHVAHFLTKYLVTN
ncbi:hydrolase [Loigolactobacillus backii]|uniref:alpha/beta hydrolase n=1 Tax=Loigolactobacillus backii TaxID=375175 RepID=UPI0007F0F4A5|nr:alpha/beta hydrolase [Loigolactobacillus backii]ANK60516.1 hydrolase [Loigolactobacillus backii]ANK65370.1 hydrolase [Loigolactobacillus backii]ANK67918.1 hydrolase [Loigolactobacillus backii]OLF70391.1 hydrolase [Loigolactobacillus backii]PIO86858.1 alpha/beta hydrolase [Loigolactobacillus backii]